MLPAGVRTERPCHQRITYYVGLNRLPSHVLGYARSAMSGDPDRDWTGWKWSAELVMDGDKQDRHTLYKIQTDGRGVLSVMQPEPSTRYLVHHAGTNWSVGTNLSPLDTEGPVPAEGSPHAFTHAFLRQAGMEAEGTSSKTVELEWVDLQDGTVSNVAHTLHPQPPVCMEYSSVFSEHFHVWHRDLMLNLPRGMDTIDDYELQRKRDCCLLCGTHITVHANGTHVYRPADAQSVTGLAYNDKVKIAVVHRYLDMFQAGSMDTSTYNVSGYLLRLFCLAEQLGFDFVDDVALLLDNDTSTEDCVALLQQLSFKLDGLPILEKAAATMQAQGKDEGLWMPLEVPQWPPLDTSAGLGQGEGLTATTLEKAAGDILDHMIWLVERHGYTPLLASCIAGIHRPDDRTTLQALRTAGVDEAHLTSPAQLARNLLRARLTEQERMPENLLAEGWDPSRIFEHAQLSDLLFVRALAWGDNPAPWSEPDTPLNDTADVSVPASL